MTEYLTVEASRSILQNRLALYLTFAGPKGGKLAAIMLTREQARALQARLASLTNKWGSDNTEVES